MPDLPPWLPDPGPWLAWAVAGSTLTVVLAAIGLPAVLTWIPADYFLETPSEHRAHSRHPVARAALALGRNTLGVLLILAGLAMLLLPGQGLLTLFAGLILTDVPGKRRVELALLRRPSVRRAVTWLRQRAGHEPLQLPD